MYADKKLYAKFETSFGDMILELYLDKAPVTTNNFVLLSTGKKEWINPNTKLKNMNKFYDGTIFHRVIPGFMIQGGDPLGNGFGGPGYKFNDEFHCDLKHDSAGILSMANSGVNSNGSQFFITDNPAPHLNNVHSVFGKVIKNMSLIGKISNVKRDVNDMPIDKVILSKVIISKNLNF